ncbi:glycosyltransferase involved in cell wall biosynthesis [Methylosinus sp. sav-2]|uniref:glycosyltransferase family 2 protein n=1 Tax=Methylosinus sp. sav-2 TaxID=2485168 RepID=UPI0009FE264A|nr:glycosyltransferase family 2 protein [Methylosinus sp. sav-2]TDX62146.1 glycosyltransferase involved in cell wall biosynthesis [Methylosinus sp. sav-2]
MSNLTAIVLVFNESIHIKRMISNLSLANANIIVVDSFSTDRSVDLVTGAGACVVQHEFSHQAQQFQWALDNLPIETEWVMRLDADETLTHELIEEIKQNLPLLPADVTGVNINRRHIFMGRWIKHGGRYPLTLLRIWRKGSAKIEQRWMDEHMVLLRGRAVTFDHDFCDDNLKDIAFFTDKHNKYATREAIDRLNAEYGLFPRDEGVEDGASSVQARLKRLVKARIYNRLPFGVGPLAYFLWRYFFQLGFLDGREGLIYHFLQAFWYRLLVDVRVLELRRAVAHLESKDAIRTELARLTGLAIEYTHCDRSSPVAPSLPA